MINFDPAVYANVFRTYSVLDAHLLSMEAQKIKKQQLEEATPHTPAKNTEEEKKEEEEKDDDDDDDDDEDEEEEKKKEEEVKKLVAKKPVRKDSYCDVLQK